MLLLVPTIVVGAGAIFLLRREQTRIAEQTAYAQEGRQAAAQARARLIVESAELLMGDVQALMLDTLAEQPAQDIDRFLTEWSRANSLVRTTFRVNGSGRLVWPRADTMEDAGRSFLRKFGRLVTERPPWQAGSKLSLSVDTARENEKSEAQTGRDQGEVLQRQQVEYNVQQVQSARRGVQDLIKDSASAANRIASTPSAAAPPARSEYDSASERKVQAAPSVPAAAFAKSAPGVEQRGWWPIDIEGRLHVLGWVRVRGEIRGVEMELASLLSRMTATLPAESPLGEGYALRDASGRLLHQTGSIAGLPVARVPFSTELLPGWDVVAFLPDAPRQLLGADFFGAGVVLVALLVIAILAGGSLLLWQARLSMEEAAQKTSFVANVSHEFKTPLTTIRLYSELLEQGRVRNEEQGREYLRTIGRETQRLARLVNNALDFSRLEQGKKKYVRETLDLREELGRLFQTHAPRIAEAGLTLNWQLPPEPVSAVVDRDALEQIVLNLLDNACKYAAEGGEVAVALEARPGGGALVRVADRGPGVPAEQRERIFDKFHRVDESLTAEKTGTGLGLSIARQLARGLGGELRCEPREGGGAEFILTLA